MVEALYFIPEGRIQKNLGTDNIGQNKNLGAADWPIHVTLGGKIDHHVDPFHQLVNQGGIANVASNKLVVGQALEILGRRKITGVGKLVEISYFVLRVLAKVVTDEVHANKSGAASH